MTRMLIGLGNTDRGDDAVGVEVARRISELAPSGVVVVETDDPASLVDLWSGAEVVVVVDAIVSHREVGSIVCFDGAHVGFPSEGWATGGTHAFGLGTAIELSRALDRLPGRLVVIGVEVDATTPSAGLSPEVSTATDLAVYVALDALEEADE